MIYTIWKLSFRTGSKGCVTEALSLKCGRTRDPDGNSDFNKMVMKHKKP